MNGSIAMDDRFDRRELLLHLGDMLDASSTLARLGEPGASVAAMMREHELHRFEFLKALAPDMTVDEFATRVASAFCQWPAQLLEAKLDREALHSTVRDQLFDGNPDGWTAYIGQVQKKVAWFGAGVSPTEKHTLAEASRDVADKTAPVADVKTRNEKKGWPWPDSGPTS